MFTSLLSFADPNALVDAVTVGTVPAPLDVRSALVLGAMVVGAAQLLKQIPFIKSRADWLVPLVAVVALGPALAFMAHLADPVLTGFVLGLEAMGIFGGVRLPWKLANGNGAAKPPVNGGGT